MFKFIKHYFVPHAGNNHRSKILHNSSLFALVILILLSSSVSVFLNRQHPEILGISYSITDQELLLLVNEQRIENGVEPLKLSNKLNIAAKNKAEHMFENNYWAHFAPDSTTPWKFIIDSGYEYIYAGENLAKGFSTADKAVEAWMNSPAHRDNILSSQYKDVGFAVVSGYLEGEETVLIVEMFGQEKNQFVAAADVENILNGNSNGASSAGASDANEIAQVPLVGGDITSNEEVRNNFQSSLYQAAPVFDSLISTKTISFVLISILLIALILDLFVVARRKIPRIVGNNLDHIFILSIFIVFIFIYNLGAVI